MNLNKLMMNYLVMCLHDIVHKELTLLYRSHLIYGKFDLFVSMILHQILREEFNGVLKTFATSVI